MPGITTGSQFYIVSIPIRSEVYNQLAFLVDLLGFFTDEIPEIGPDRHRLNGRITNAIKNEFLSMDALYGE